MIEYKYKENKTIDIKNYKDWYKMNKISKAKAIESSKYNLDMYGNLNVLTRDGYRNIIPSTIYYLKADKQEYSVA